MFNRSSPSAANFVFRVFIRRSAVFFALAGMAWGAEPCLYFNSFERALNADFACGNARSISNDRTEVVKLANANRSGVLSVPFSDYFCLELEKNMFFREGTIRMEVSPRFTLPAIRDGYGRTQTLLNTDIRTGQSFSLKARFDRQKAQLTFETKAGRNEKASKVSVDIGDWKTGDWHTIEIAWKQPGLLFLAVDGVGTEITDAKIPMLPAAMMYDLFVGTNSWGTSGYGDTAHADFYFDNLAIFSAYKYNPSAGWQQRLAGPAKRPDANTKPTWVGKNKHRLNVHAGKTNNDWRQTPVRLEVDFGASWDALDAAGRRAAIDSLRLVEYDSVTGLPIVQNDTLNGDDKYYRPFRSSEELYWQSKGTISWVRHGNRPAAYSLYYDCDAPYAQSFPRLVPMTGDGDRLQLGRKGDVGPLSLGISGSFDILHSKDNRPLGLWANVGTETFPRSRDLGYGLYYFERLKDERGIIFAPGQLIYKGSTSHGALVSGNNVPNIADINGDGNPDFVYTGGKLQEWWEFEMKKGRPIITAQHSLSFLGSPPAGENKSVVYDYNGDGLMDLQLGRMVFLNTGAKTAPIFDAKNIIKLDLDAPVAFGEPYLFYGEAVEGVDESVAREWMYFPVDWDGDGKRDLITSSFFPYLYFRKNMGTNEAPRFGKREQLTTFDRQELHVVTMLTYVRVLDWDGDGDLDLLFGGEDGAVGFCENIAGPRQIPQLAQTVFLNQLNAPMDAGSLAIPVAADWDDDGDIDLIVGNSAGHVLFSVASHSEGA